MQMIAGERIYELAASIFPICRSITGKGVRDTLKILGNYIGNDCGTELSVHEVPTGTKVFDWVVPKEWVIREAYIADESGKHIADMAEHNLHILGYSGPVDRWVELKELKEYIFTQPQQPDVIPYVTSYYKERYGFCLSENQKNTLCEGKYHMHIDSELINGSLTYGEVIVPGKSDNEIFFSTYICHPSMANDECSGPSLVAELVRYVASLPERRYTYRFVYVPETIGAITYLATKGHLEYMKEHMLAGFNLSCVGDDRDYSIVESRYADTLADKVLKNVLGNRGTYSNYSFLQRGSDERQYNAPGVELPVVCFCRSKFDVYPEYHTSADDLKLISPAGFQGSFDVMTEVIQALEHNACYKMTVCCEPQLGKRGLYPTLSQKNSYDKVETMMNFIAYADGKMDLVDISDTIHVPINELIPLVDKLTETGLLEACEGMREHI